MLIEKLKLKITTKSQINNVQPKLKLIANYSRRLQRPALLLQILLLAVSAITLRLPWRKWRKSATISYIFQEYCPAFKKLETHYCLKTP